MQKKVFGLASVTTTTAILIACNAPQPTLVDGNEPTEPESTSSSSKKDAGKDTPKEDGGEPEGKTPPKSDGGAPPATGACSDRTTRDACSTCCDDLHPKGLDFLYAEIDKCLCEGASGCKAECATTICSTTDPKAPDAACDACIDKNTVCFDNAFKTCEGNADCKALLKCDDESQCADKPK